jgi:hypothetical protein
MEFWEKPVPLCPCGGSPVFWAHDWTGKCPDCGKIVGMDGKYVVPAPSIATLQAQHDADRQRISALSDQNEALTNELDELKYGEGAEADRQRIAELEKRIERLTIDCDAYILTDGHCLRYETNEVCPRDAKCRNLDRLAQAEAERDEAKNQAAYYAVQFEFDLTNDTRLVDAVRRAEQAESDLAFEKAWNADAMAWLWDIRGQAEERGQLESDLAAAQHMAQGWHKAFKHEAEKAEAARAEAEKWEWMLKADIVETASGIRPGEWDATFAPYQERLADLEAEYAVAHGQEEKPPPWTDDPPICSICGADAPSHHWYPPNPTGFRVCPDCIGPCHVAAAHGQEGT